MKKLFAAACAFGILLGTAGAASAAQGCGRGWHRDPYGHCRPNRGPGPVVVAPGLVIGGFYHGRGWLDGRRYWHHRRWRHGRWAYY